MSDFLPSDYEVPSTSNYMKFIIGDNRFRILASPIIGWETWTEENGARKPLRTPMKKPFTVDVVDNPEEIKHFWAMPVYNYQDKRIQILEITQKGIQKTLKALARDEDWGSPVQKYDLVVTRTGDGMETRYEVLPKPASPMDDSIIKEYETMKINLNALFDGDDPFAQGKEKLENVDPDEVDI